MTVRLWDYSILFVDRLRFLLGKFRTHMCHSIWVFFYALLFFELVLFYIGIKGKEVITIANLKQAKTDDEIKRLTVNSVKTAYHDLALDYNHLLNLDYIYCPHCGKWKSTNGNSNFYRSNKSKSGFEHFACKSCILDLCTDVDPKTGVRTDNREKTINTFRQLDWKFSESDYNAQLQTINEGVGEKVRGTAVQNLIVMVASLPQYKNKTYKDSEFAIVDF